MTSSTWSSPAPPCRATWPTCKRWQPNTAPSSPGCGHVGDGNVHMSVFQPDAQKRAEVLRAIFRAGIELGGAVSAEHGIGTEKMRYFLEFEDPAKVALMLRLKSAFDPHNILSPGKVFGNRPTSRRGDAVNGAQALIATLVGVRRRGVLRQSRYLGDALRRRARRRAPDAGRARPVRRSRHRSGRRIRTGGTAPCRHLAASRSRPRKRDRQSSQRPAGAYAGGEHRRRPCDLSPTLRCTPAERHRVPRPSRVGLVPELELGPGDVAADAAEAVRASLRAPGRRRHLGGPGRRVVARGGRAGRRASSGRPGTPSTPASSTPSPRCCDRVSPPRSLSAAP